MAKKNKVQIDVEVKGKGFKKVSLDANKAGDGLDKTAKGAQSADRAVKGAGQVSSNSTKNFAKMAQGISGGLVPAYAAFAAQVFALSAAFNFLKNAVDVENLRKSQVNYAQSTGIAMKSLTNSLETASKGMLNFQEAAEAVAIGTAKGFSGEQLNQLAEGALKASTALGRGYEDTFDRLLRGVSKAEPELLDELGITLRLETATRRYADAIGKTREELTDAERSQAVFVETARQLNENFGNVDAAVNPFVQLSKTFDELIQKVAEKLLPSLVSIAEFANSNAKAAAAAFAAIGALIILNITGLKEAVFGAGAFIGKIFTSTFGAIGAGFSTALDAGINFGNALISKMEELDNRISSSAGKAASLAASFKKSSDSKLLQKVQSGEKLTGLDKNNLKRAIESAEKQFKQHGKVIKGIFEDASEQSLKEFKEAFEDMTDVSKKSGVRIGKVFTKPVVLGLKAVRQGAKLVAAGARGIAIGFNIASKAVRAFGKATIVLGILQELYFLFEKVSQAPLKLVESIEKMVVNVAKALQFLGNVWIKLFNGLIDKIPDSVKEILGIEGGGATIEPFKFADELEKNISGYTDKILEFVGTDREALNVIQDNNEALARQADQLEELSEKYRNLSSDMDSIFTGISLDLISGKDINTETIANAIGTLPIEGALKAADTPEAKKILDSMLDKFDFSVLGQNFAEAVAKARAGDYGDLQGLMTSAVAYSSNLAQVRDTIGNLGTTIDTKNPLGTKVLLENMLNTATAADGAATNLNRSGTAVEEANAAIQNGTVSEWVMKLEEYAATQDSILSKTHELNMAEAQRTRLPGLLKQQLGLQINADREAIKLRQLKLDLNNELVRDLAALDPEAQRLHENEVTRLSREIELQSLKVDETRKNATDIAQIGTNIGESLTSGLTSAFDSIIQGTKSAKQAFADLARGILQSLAQVIAKLLVTKLLTAALGGTSFGGFLGIPEGRTGGVFSQGRKMPGYATGGVAKGPRAGYPAILHGTEAVVPLPDGKSIPVQMAGVGQNNNVTVNVAIDGQGRASSNTQQDSAQAGNLGNIIAKAVQQELQNQKRSGGILNPYGVA
jgi:hypothetical protein